MATVSVNQLSFAYPSNDDASVDAQLTLDQLSAEFPTGQFSLLTGPSGSGKSTLLKLISGLYPQFAGHQVAGEITLDGQPVDQIDAEHRAAMVAMMFQNPNEQFAMDTVENELIFTLENQQVAPSEMADRVDHALTYVGIDDLRHRQLNSLSGGEKQKVALAVIVVMATDTILLDEPFASVDPDARQVLLTKLSQLQREEHKTIIIADHDLEDYAPLVDQMYLLNAGGTELTHLSSTEASDRLNQFTRETVTETSLALPKPEDEQALITLDHLHLQAGERVLLDQPDFKFYQNRVTLLTGPNGSGKSTLLTAIAKLRRYDGSIKLADKEVSKLRPKPLYRQLGLVFQDASQQFLNVTVAEELDLSLKNSQQADYFRDKLDGFLTELHLDGLQEQVVYSLSGGQKKKLQILEMLMMATPVLLFDEPFTGLDFTSLQQILQLMKQVVRDCHQTYIIVSHQLFGIDTLIDYHVALADQQLQYVGRLAQ